MHLRTASSIQHGNRILDLLQENIGDTIKMKNSSVIATALVAAFAGNALMIYLGNELILNKDRAILLIVAYFIVSAIEDK